MPEINGDPNIRVNKTLTADRITMGRYFNDGNYDVIRSAGPSGLLLTSVTNNVYIWGNNLTVDRNLTVVGDTQINSNARINGNLFVKGSNMNDDLPRLKLMLQIFRAGPTTTGPMISCHPGRPVIGVDGWISGQDNTSYLFEVRHYSNLITEPMLYINQGSAGKVTTIANAHDRMNYIFIYPGYGAQCWSNINFVNRDGSRPNPITCNNTSMDIAYYDLRTGVEATPANMDNYGVNLANPIPWNLRQPGTDDCWDMLRSIRVYKLS
jgi:hypothetical protein